MYKIKVHISTPGGMHYEVKTLPSFDEVFQYIEYLYLNYTSVEELFLERTE